LVSTNTQSLWKDLIKYQSRPNQRVDGESAIGNAESGEDLPEEALLASDEINRTLSSNAVESVDSQQTMALENSEKILFSASCEIITSATNSLCRPAYGILEVTSTKITFTKKGPAPQKKPAVVNFHSSQMENDQFLWAIRTFPSTQWSVEEIRNVLPRTFYLRQIAVELFLTSRRCVFVNLLHQHAAMQFIIAIRFLVKPPFIEPYYGLKPQHIVQKMLAPGTTSQLTLAWQNREISNFQYLMHLNTIAGRSFNDLGQYPVFPWVIADYVSSELRLRDPGTFRDLRWPVGAQRKEQREEIIARYEDLDMMYEMSLQEHNDAIPALPPFHFGSHYSTAGFVMWFLMRMEPYTSLHVQLQDGKFDKADRLFDSLAAAWNGCIHNPSDVKELVPEFFYCPEILENMNRLDLGRKMNGDRKLLGEIELPPWATDSFDFVRLHRKALESEYVSQHLHHWIDLIFGYKQRPPYMRNGGNKAAVESCNVFFHLTYAGAVDLEELLEKDKVLYGQYVNQIAEFGQTPAQLFSSPHPQRLSLDDADIAWPIASVVLGADTIMRGGVVPDKPKKVMCFKAYKMSARPIVFIGESGDRLVTVDSSRVIGNHLWQCLQPDVTPPYKLKIDTVALEVSQG
jgi:neurobeachin-like protein 1/2